MSIHLLLGLAGMGRASIVVVLIVLAGPFGAFAPSTSAQTNLFPDVNISCDDPTEDMEVYPGATRTVVVYCVLENPTVHQEKVDVTIESGNFAAAGPASVTIGSGSEVDIQIVFRGDENHAPGSYLANISAQVVEANGVQVGFITSPEYAEVTIVVAEYSGCTHSIGQGGGSFEAGEIVSFSASISCQGNTDVDVSYRAVMVEEGSSSSSWPSGFDDQSPSCDVSTDGGSATKSCSFQILTPSNLDRVWKGCVFVIESASANPSACPDSGSLLIEVEPKGLGLESLGLSGNESVSDFLQGNKEVVAGGAGALLVVFVALALLRRLRRGRYED